MAVEQAPAPQIDWSAIASHYAGKPIQVAFPDKKPGTENGIWGTGISGNVSNGIANLSPDTKKALDAWLASPKKKSRDGAVRGTLALSTLLHEALHTRTNQPGTGFEDWQEDENQARALGFELLPDMLQRFFGIKIGSKVGREYERVARKMANDYVYRRG